MAEGRKDTEEKVVKQEAEKVTKPSDETFSADVLLQRSVPEDYVEEWTTLLGSDKGEAELSGQNSVVIFRLGHEWLALSTHVFSQVIIQRPIHKIPHSGGEFLLGVVNVEGQLRLCVAMHCLLELGLDNLFNREETLMTSPRMIVIAKAKSVWVFPVNEVCGIYSFLPETVQNVPVNVAKSTANFLQGVIEWNQKSVSYLDEKLVFESLQRKVLG